MFHLKTCILTVCFNNAKMNCIFHQLKNHGTFILPGSVCKYMHGFFQCISKMSELIDLCNSQKFPWHYLCLLVNYEKNAKGCAVSEYWTFSTRCLKRCHRIRISFVTQNCSKGCFYKSITFPSRGSSCNWDKVRNFTH